MIDRLQQRPQGPYIRLVSAYVTFRRISYTSITMILVFASSSYFTLPVPMREVSCVGDTPRAWDPRSYSPY